MTDKEVVQESIDSWNEQTSGQIALAGGLIAAAMAIKVIKFSWMMVNRRKYKNPEDKIKAQITAIGTNSKLCNKSKDPQKCKEKLQKKILKLKAKLVK